MEDILGVNVNVVLQRHPIFDGRGKEERNSLSQACIPQERAKVVFR